MQGLSRFENSGFANGPRPGRRHPHRERVEGAEVGRHREVSDGDYMIFFTNGKSDSFFVVRKYQDTFEEVLGSTEIQNFIGMWGDEHAVTLAEALLHCARLRDLLLASNNIGYIGATHPWQRRSLRFPTCET